MKKAFGTFWQNLLSLLLFAVVAACVLVGVSNAAEKNAEAELNAAYDSIRRAVVTCYAVEGSYPESYEYLKRHYGVRGDEEKYAVMYSVFASNIMPDVTILKR